MTICGNFDNLKLHKKNPLLKVEELDIRNIDHSSNLFKNIDYVFHFAGIGDIVPSIESGISFKQQLCYTFLNTRFAMGPLRAEESRFCVVAKH